MFKNVPPRLCHGHGRLHRHSADGPGADAGVGPRRSIFSREWHLRVGPIGSGPCRGTARAQSEPKVMNSHAGFWFCTFPPRPDPLGTRDRAWARPSSSTPADRPRTKPSMPPESALAGR